MGWIPEPHDLIADRKQQGNGCCPGGIHGGQSRGHSLKSEWAEEHPEFCKRQLADSRDWITRSSGYKHCHERPKFDFMIVDGLLSQRSHLFGQLAEAHRKRLLYSTMVKLVSYHQELNEHDYILYRLQSRWRRKKCWIIFCQNSNCKILEKHFHCPWILEIKFYTICRCIGQFFFAFATQLAISEDDFTEANCCEAQRCGEKAFTRYCIPNFIVMIKANMDRVEMVLGSCSVLSRVGAFQLGSL